MMRLARKEAAAVRRPVASGLSRRACAGLTRRLTPLLPPAGPLRRYAVLSLVDSTGTGLFLAAGTLFFTRVAGLPAGLVGLGLSFAGLAAMLACIPAGSLGDKLGHRKVWAALTSVQALTYACYPLVRSFAAFVAVVTVVAVSQAGTAPIRSAYLSQAAGPEKRVGASAYNQAVYNAGFAAGAAAAGVALDIGSRDAYMILVLANAASYAISAAIVLTLPAREPAQPSDAEPGALSGVRGVLRDIRFLVVSALNGLLMTYGAVLTVALPLWIVDRTAAPLGRRGAAGAEYPLGHNIASDR
jgi:MFS family permease